MRVCKYISQTSPDQTLQCGLVVDELYCFSETLTLRISIWVGTTFFQFGSISKGFAVRVIFC